MFGYTLPLYARLPAPDLIDYRRYYCETCHQLRDLFGLTSTSTVNYDMTFNTIILNSIYGEVLDFKDTKKSFCVFRGPYARSELMEKMAAYTILLTKWELVDDQYDEPSGKNKFISLGLNRAIKKAERMYPEYDRIVGEGYNKLRGLELDGCTDAKMMGYEFGRALSLPLEDIAGGVPDPHVNDLFTHLTTIVYIMDAVDDLDEDYLEGTYNPFLARYSDFLEEKEGDGAGCEDRCSESSCSGGCGCGPFKNRDAFVNENLYEITGLMNSVIGDLQTSYSHVRKNLRSSVGVTDNIVMLGIPESAKNVLTGRSLAKASIKNTMERRAERNRSL